MLRVLCTSDNFNDTLRVQDTLAPVSDNLFNRRNNNHNNNDGHNNPDFVAAMNDKLLNCTTFF